MMDPTLLAAILIIPIFFLLLARRKVISQKAAALPSPPRLPFIGNLHQLGSIPHRSLYKLSKEHGPLMLLHLGSIRTLVVSCPKIAEEVIRNNDLAFASRPKSRVMDVLSYNKKDVAFAQYGESWRQMKKLARTHLLSSQRVKSMSFVRAEGVSLLLEEVADATSRGNGSVICLTEIMNSYVTNVITRMVLGSWVTKEKAALLSELSHVSSTLFYQVFFVDIFPNLKWLDVLLGSDRKLENYKKNWDTLFEEVTKNHVHESKEVNGKNNPYFMGTLLDLQNDPTLGFVLTDDHIRGLTLNMIVAGIDTTSTALDWCMVELVRNPEVMKKVKDELRKVAHGEDMISEELLGQLRYLKVFIKEVLRLHPPGPLLLPHESLQECQIQGYNIPKQTRLVINAWAFGRDESYWEAPEQFKPERFFDCNLDYKGKDFFFIPFGAGRRICPGMDFGMTIIEIALANLVHRFDWSLPSGITVEDMDMDESGEIISFRKQKLELVPTASKVN